MSEKQAPPGNPFDPTGAWREGRDTYLDAWAKAMVEAVNSDQYAKATGAMLDSYLTASSPLREVLEKSMLQALQNLHMPSSADVIALAERVTNIEMRLDDMDAKLDRIVQQVAPRVSPRPAGGPAKRKSTPRKRKS